MTGLLLFAHGARDLRWREPFDRLKEAVSLRHPGPVELAFLESMQPDLGTAACRLKDAGAHRVVVVPLFLGTGGHLRRDLPAMIAAAEEQAQIPLSATAAVGEDAAVMAAMADYCIRAAI